MDPDRVPGAGYPYCRRLGRARRRRSLTALKRRPRLPPFRRCRWRNGARRRVRSSDARETDAGCDRRRNGGDWIERKGGGFGRYSRCAARAQGSWSFPHFDTITVSMADAPRPGEILVVTAIADGGRL